MARWQQQGKQQRHVSILDHDTATHIADLAVNGTTVAIAAADDPVYDFYLLKVTSEGVEELKTTLQLTMSAPHLGVYKP